MFWTRLSHTTPLIYIFDKISNYIADNDRMDGFKLYISNTSKIPPSDYLCYKDSAEGFPKVTETIPCNQIGQYIIYYDDKVGYGDFGNVIELCYVAIYGKFVIRIVR